MTLQPITIDTHGTSSTAPTVATGTLLNELRDILDQTDELNCQLGLLRDRRNEIEEQLKSEAERTGLDSFSNDQLSVTVKDDVVVSYDPEKWSELFEWAARTNNSHIIQRRLSSRPIMELIDNGIEMPEGIKFEPVTKINTRRK